MPVSLTEMLNEENFLPAGEVMDMLSGKDTLEPLATALGRECGWDAPRQAAEIAAFRSEAQAEGIVVAAVAV